LGEACSTWALQAAATVIQRRIISLYPPVYGAAGIPEKLLNCMFEPASRRRNNMYQSVSVMWTRNTPSHQRSTTWTPNHFAPVLPALAVTEVTAVTADVDAEAHGPAVQRTEVGIDRANDDDDRVGDGQERLATAQCDRSTDSHAPESVDLNEQAATNQEDCAEPYPGDGIHNVGGEYGDDDNDEE